MSIKYSKLHGAYIARAVVLDFSGGHYLITGLGLTFAEALTNCWSECLKQRTYER